MKYSRSFNIFVLILGVLCIAYYIGMGLAVRFGQSLLFLWPLVGVACIVRYILVRRAIVTGKPLPIPRPLIIALRVCVVVFLAFFIFVECFICSGAYTETPAGLDCIIVLGARVNGRVPSGALTQRIWAAEEYLRANPDTLCIASGGQGDDEEISEAYCIREKLTELGVDPDRILLEDRSTDTVSNLANSLALMPADTRTVGVVTNDFHIFRALCTARQLSGLTFCGVPAQSTVYGFLHYAMREFFAVVVGALQGELSLA